MKVKLVSAPYLVWMVVFIVVPLIMVGYFAFTDKSGHFTLEYIADVASIDNASEQVLTNKEDDYDDFFDDFFFEE